MGIAEQDSGRVPCALRNHFYRWYRLLIGGLTKIATPQWCGYLHAPPNYNHRRVKMRNIQKTAIYATCEEVVLNITGGWEHWFDWVT